MANDYPLRFVCNVMTATRGCAYAELTISALLLGFAVHFTAGWLLATESMFGQLTTLGVAGLLLYWTSGNPMLKFFREYQYVQGITSPAASVKSVHWFAFAFASTMIMSNSSSDAKAALLLFGGLVCFVWISLVVLGYPFRRALSDYMELIFVFIKYPDSRYSGVAGTKGLWIPPSSMGLRMVVGSSYLVMVHIPLAMGTMRSRINAPGELLFGEAAASIALLPLLAFPHLLLFAAMLRPMARYLSSTTNTIGSNNEWDRAAHVVAGSKWLEGDVALADHFFIGWHLPKCDAAAHPFHKAGEFDLPCHTPALLHRSILAGHVHLLGSSQSGKTSIGLITILVQCVRGWSVRALDYFGRPVRNSNGEQVWSRSEHLPMLIIDMKGDLALFNTTREECQKSGQVFKFFTLSRGLATSNFNALPNLGLHDRHIAEFCELVLNALSLFHGLSYGRSYYSKQSRDLLLKTLKSTTRRPRNWEELYDLLLSEIDPKKHKDVFELVSSIFALAQYPVLGPAPAGVDEIHMPTVIAERQVVYFSLPARLSAISARDVGKLALFAFVTAAADWNDRNPERRSVVFLDEAQILVSSNLATLFQQCSGAKASIILSNQARSDLNVPDAPHLSETVRVNTRFKQMFTVVDPQDAEDLINMSGERIGILRSITQGFDGRGYPTSSATEKETLCRILNQNEINAANNDPTGSLIHVTTDAGFTRLEGVARHIRTPYPMSAEEYRRRLHTPWPAAPQVVATPEGSACTVVNRQEPEEVQRQAEQDYAALMDFFRQTARRAGRDRMRDWTEPED